MKVKRILSTIITLAMILSMVAVPSAIADTNYTAENGWTLNGGVVQADGSLSVPSGSTNAIIYKPNLEARKKYSITYDVTGMGTGDSWTYQFLANLVAGGTDAGVVLSYRMSSGGRWNKSPNDDTLVATGTDGKHEIIIDTATGEWSTYALGNLSQSGTFADTTDFSIKFYRWGGTEPYISNVVVKEIIYTAANGWTLNGGAVQADGSVNVPAGSSSAIVFKPNLDPSKKYSIKYDVTGLSTGDSWSFQFFADMSAGGVNVGNVLAYRMAGKWIKSSSDDTLVATGTNGTNEIIIDMETGEWSTYALGALAQTGTLSSTADFTLKFYHWGSMADPYINNVTITEIRENVIYTEENGWTVNSGVEQEDGSISIPSGSSNAVIYKPNLEANKKYSIKYDVTGLSTGDSWSFQFFADMSAGGVNVGNVLAYRMAGKWIKSSSDDTLVATGTNGTNEIIIDMETGEWSTYALGALAQTGTLASTADFTLKFYHWGSMADPYISNVTVTEIRKNIIYTEENGWTVNSGVEQEDGSISIPSGSSNAVIYKPNLEANKKYSIKYDVTGLSKVSGSWDYQFIFGMTAGSTDMATALMYRMGGDWRIDGGNTVVTSGSNGTNEVIIDMETGEYELYALGALAQTGTLASTTAFTLKFYHWGSMADPYISNVTVTEIRKNIIYTAENGWTVNGGVEQEDGSLSVPSGSSNAVIYKPNLEAGKKYSITYDVTGMGTGDSWTYQFFADLLAGGTDAGVVLSYRMTSGGRWNKSPNDDTLVATGTDGKHEIIIDTETGEWATYALGNLSQTGTFADTSDFTIKFYRWGGPEPYISNVVVKEIIYTSTKGWTLNGGVEQEDGSISIPSGSGSAVIFKPNLDPNKKYSITYDVTGLSTVGGSWEYQFILGMSAGGTDMATALMYRMGGDWRTDGGNTVVTSGSNGTNEIIIDMKTGEYSLYVLGTLAKVGTFENTSNFTLKFYHWGSMEDPYISNIKVKEYSVPAPILVSEDIKIFAGDIEQNSVNAGRGINKITVNFGQSMDSTYMTDSYIYVVEKEGNAKVAGTYSYADGIFTITYTTKFAIGKTYTVKVLQVKNSSGVMTQEEYAKDFTIGTAGTYAELINIKQNNTEVTTAKGLIPGPAKINISYSDSKGTAPVLHVIVAYYNGTEIVHADVIKQATPLGQSTADYTLDYTVPTLTKSYDSVQVMVWNGFNTLKPLSQVINLP